MRNRVLKLILNGRNSWSVRIKAGGPSTIFLDLPCLFVKCCFLIFINDIPVTSVPNWVFILRTQLNTLVFIVNLIDPTKKKITAAFKNNIPSVVNRGKWWLVNFNVFKPKLLSFNYYRELFWASVSMDDANVWKASNALQNIRFSNGIKSIDPNLQRTY